MGKLRTAIWIAGFAVLLALLYWTGANARAEDFYTDFAVTAIDTLPTDCSLADGCANVQGRSVSIKNTGSVVIFTRCDVAVTFDTTGMIGIPAGETVEIDGTGRTMKCGKLFLKTASGTSTATVRRVR